MKYRPEIDGLRAIAVLPVILFHAGLQGFNGGFVGVDVFFVISGFLITSILMRDIEKQRFSLLQFYERRARRILPALFFVVLCTLPFAWLWMLPHQLHNFSQGLIAVFLFISNILFGRKSDYFAPATEENPLLHTWSLAVEEQYYLLFPLFLVFAWRWGKQKLYYSLMFFALLSLGLSEWNWRNESIANFFLAPARAWELFAGSLAAFIADKHGVRANNWLSSLGLFLVISSIFAYDKNTPFPSIYAIPPVLGTALIMLFAKQGTLVARLLSWKPMIQIGLISYSAYLWHQPLFAFARIRSLNEPSHGLMLTLSVLSLVLAWMSVRWIETPFRVKRNGLFERQMIFTYSLLGSLCFIALGFMGYQNKGFKNRFDNQYIQFLANFEKTQRAENAQACTHLDDLDGCVLGSNMPKPTIVLFGDSHAGMLRGSLAKLAQELDLKVLFFASNCPPVMDVYANLSVERCNEFNAKTFQWIKSHPEIKTVILASRWTLSVEKKRYINGLGGAESGVDFWLDLIDEHGQKVTHTSESKRQKAVLKQYQATIESLLKADKQVIVVKPIPEMGWNIPNLLIKKKLFNQQEAPEVYVPFSSYEQRNQKVLNLFESMEMQAQQTDQKLKFVDPAQVLCNRSRQKCYGAKGTEIYYFDDDHLSQNASHKLNPLFKAILAP